MITPTTDPRRAAAVDFVRAGYAGATLDFLTGPITDIGTADACIRAMGTCNHFDPARAADKLRPVLGELMSVQAGRAGSPLIVLNLPYFEQQRASRLYPLCVAIPEDQRQALAERLAAIGRELRADSARIERYGDRVGSVRLWWD